MPGHIGIVVTVPLSIIFYYNTHEHVSHTYIHNHILFSLEIVGQKLLMRELLMKTGSLLTDSSLSFTSVMLLLLLNSFGK